MTNLQEAADELTRLSCGHLGEPEGLHDVAAALHRLCAEIGHAERMGIPRETIQDVVAEAREACGRSPFVARLQQWPRGYPGDFETIEYLLRQENQAPEGSLEYWIESLSLNSPIAQQHRNKVTAQAGEIQDAILRPSTAVPRILVLAAGSAPDVALIERVIADRNFELVLCDGDEGRCGSRRVDSKRSEIGWPSSTATC